MRILSFLFLCIFLGQLSVAQNSNMAFRHLTTVDGLSRNEDYTILLYCQVFMWWIEPKVELSGYESIKPENKSESESQRHLSDNKVVDSEKNNLHANKTENFTKEPFRYDDPVKLLETTKNDTLKARILTELCWNHRYDSLSLALNYGAKAFEIYKKQNDLLNQCDVLNKIGVAKRCNGQFIEALDDYYMVLSIAQQPSCNIQIAYAYNNIGDIYFRLEKYDEANNYVNKSLAINRLIKSKEGEAYNLLLLGNISDGQKRWLQSIAFYKQALKIRLNIGATNIAVICEEIGDCFMELNLRDSAFCYYNKANDYGDISFSGYYLKLGNYYYSNKQYKQAIFYLKKSIELSPVKNQHEKILAYSLLNKIYFALHKYKEAYIMQSKTVALTDSLKSAENVKKMTQMQMRYDFEQKMRLKEMEEKNEKMLYESKIERQHVILYGLIIILLAITTTVIFIVRNSRYIKKTNQILKEKNNEINTKNIFIQKSYSLLKATLESIHNGILVVNQHGAVVTSNARFAEMWNISDEVLASGDDKVLMESMLAQLADADEFLAKVMELYRNPEAESLDLIDFKDGRTFERISKPMFIGSEPQGRVWSFTDITDRLRQEFEIKLMNEQLFEANAAKDKFFSIIAHDLRGPFSGFLGLTEIMAEELRSLTITQIQEISVDLRKSASNLYRLLENLLQWSKMQQGTIPFNPELLQLLQVVDEYIEMAIEQAKNKGIEITYNIPDNLKVFADKNMLQTVIRNLVSNAMKFTPKGGRIWISAKATDNQNIEISVQDSGIGMKPEMVGNLFRIDVKTNREGTDGEPSSGLGLLLCKEFIERQGGKIWVESAEGKGTTFYFSMPCVANLGENQSLPAEGNGSENLVAPV